MNIGFARRLCCALVLASSLLGTAAHAASDSYVTVISRSINSISSNGAINTNYNPVLYKPYSDSGPATLYQAGTIGGRSFAMSELFQIPALTNIPKLGTVFYNFTTTQNTASVPLRIYFNIATTATNGSLQNTIPIGIYGTQGISFTGTRDSTNQSISLTKSITLPSDYAAELTKAVGSSTFGKYIQVTLASPTLFGAGAPGPIAGAGLPVLLAAAGFAWVRRKHGARTI